MNYFLCLLYLTTTATHSTANVAAYRSAVCLRTLSACREVLDVASAAVCLDVLQSLDVLLNFSLKIAFRLEAFDLAADLVLLVRSKFRSLHAHIKSELLDDLLCTWASNTIYGSKRNFETLVFWEGDT